MVGSAPDLLYGRMYTYHLDKAPYAPYAPYTRNTTYIILKLGLSLQLIAEEGKLFQKLSRVAPILGLLETLIHENHGAT